MMPRIQFKGSYASVLGFVECRSLDATMELRVV